MISDSADLNLTNKNQSEIDSKNICAIIEKPAQIVNGTGRINLYKKITNFDLSKSMLHASTITKRGNTLFAYR